MIPLQLAFYDPDQEITITDEKGESTKTGRELLDAPPIPLNCDVTITFVSLFFVLRRLVNDKKGVCSEKDVFNFMCFKTI